MPVLLSVLKSHVQTHAVVLHGFRFGSRSVPIQMSPGVSLYVMVSSALVWRKLINSPAVLLWTFIYSICLRLKSCCSLGCCSGLPESKSFQAELKLIGLIDQVGSMWSQLRCQFATVPRSKCGSQNAKLVVKEAVLTLQEQHGRAAWKQDTCVHLLWHTN